MKGFYSPIERLLEQSTRGKGTGTEFMTELSKQPGYKQAEVEDRDLQALMALPKMAREEFMAQLKAKPGVVPQEEVRSTKLTGSQRLAQAQRAALEEHGRPYGELDHDEQQSIDRYIEDDQTSHKDYTLPGGENYREILLQHPKGNFPGVGAHFGGTPNILASIRVKDRVIPGEMGYTLRNKKSGLKGQHYGTEEEAQAAIQGYPENLRPMLGVVPNQGPDKKVLHIEEIQSDWHQQGREKGYAPKGVDLKEQARRAKFKHTMASDQLKEAKERSASIDRDLASDAPLFQDPVVRERLAKAQVEYNNRIMDLMPEVMKAEEAHRAAEQQAKQAIPDAPFKKNWHELALKRMIQHAAENGYDSIAITPGEEQAKRYGLSKHVGMVSYNPDEQHFQAFKPNRETLMNEKGASPERVAELIGKDAATRLMSAPAQMGHHFLEGEDLNIGGEGMKGFYDKMVPKFLNQFGKKYGAQVGAHTLDVPKMINVGSGAKTEVGREQIPLHSFPITPEMRQDVLKNGISMYAEGGAVGRDENLRKFLDTSKIKDRLYHATPKSFKTFKPGGHDPRISGHAIWLGTDPKYQPAMHHISGGEHADFREGTNVMPVHVQAKNPLLLDDKDMLEWAQAVYAGGSKEFPELMPKAWADEVKKDYDSIIHADPWKRGDAHEVIVFHPNQIKSAIGNRGTYDPAKADITKAKGGVVSRETIKPVAHGIIKERVTVSPNLDAMQYELLSAKHFTKKVK